RENVNIKAENTRLKQAIEENVKCEAEYEIRIKKLEQSNKENINLKDKVMKLRNDIEEIKKKDQIINNTQDILSTEDILSENLEQIDNISNFNEFNDVPDSDISDNIFSETKRYKNKEIKFLEREHKEHISNEIRERNQKKFRSQDPILKPSNLLYNDQNLEKAESRDCVSSEQNSDTQEIKKSKIDIQSLI
ncbi:17790_t:CDS:2, partial [Cetraspora pellucida]